MTVERARPHGDNIRGAVHPETRDVLNVFEPEVLAMASVHMADPRRLQHHPITGLRMRAVDLREGIADPATSTEKPAFWSQWAKGPITPGSRWIVRGFVDVDSQGNARVRTDERDPFVFPIGEVANDVQSFFRNSAGVPFGMVLEYQDDAMRLVPVVVGPTVNPTNETLSNMPGGTSVVVQGRVSDVAIDATGRIANTMNITTSDKETITVVLGEGWPNYADSEYELIREPVGKNNYVRTTGSTVRRKGETAIVVGDRFYGSKGEVKTILRTLVQRRLLNYSELRDIPERSPYQQELLEDAFLHWREYARELSTEDPNRKAILEALLGGQIPGSVPFFTVTDELFPRVENIHERTHINLESYPQDLALEFMGVIAGRTVESGSDSSISVAVAEVAAASLGQESMLTVIDRGIEGRMDLLVGEFITEQAREAHVFELGAMRDFLFQQNTSGITERLFYIVDNAVGADDPFFDGYRTDSIRTLYRYLNQTIAVVAGEQPVDRLGELMQHEATLSRWRASGRLSGSELYHVNLMLSQIARRRKQQAADQDVPHQVTSDPEPDADSDHEEARQRAARLGSWQSGLRRGEEEFGRPTVSDDAVVIVSRPGTILNEDYDGDHTINGLPVRRRPTQ